MYVACEKGHLEVATLLINQGANLNAAINVCFLFGKKRQKRK